MEVSVTLIGYYFGTIILSGMAPSCQLINSLCCSIKYQPLNDNNSEEFQASFVLEFCKPLPAAVEIVQKIHEVINKTGTNSVEISNEVYIIYRFSQA